MLAIVPPAVNDREEQIARSSATIPSATSSRASAQPSMRTAGARALRLIREAADLQQRAPAEAAVAELRTQVAVGAAVARRAAAAVVVADAGAKNVVE
jgi:hypothetical protein